MSERKQKLIIGHTYIIYELEKNEVYYGKCEINELYKESYLFSGVTNMTNKYIGFRDFSKNSIFVDTHDKID
jgi:hypothetical protein